MANILILTGPTGCGKTYSAFKHLNKKDKAIYMAPCRQLVYESFIKYHKEGDSLLCSDIKINGKGNNIFATYESITPKNLKEADVLIIDEAHFLTDEERGPHLRSLIAYGEKMNKKMLLLTATVTFKLKKAKVLHLQPKQKFNKEEVNYSSFKERMKAGVPTLVFCSRKDECGDYARAYGLKGAVITADTPVVDRIRLINLFQQGKITLIEATNAMAQGVNVSCENLFINYSSWDDDATVIQKYGRLGRMGITQNNNLTYNYNYDDKLDINKLYKNLEERTVKLSIKKHVAKKPHQEESRQDLSKKEKQQLQKLLKI